MSRLSYTQGSLPKSMLRFAGPFLLSSILQNLYGSVDLLVVGHFGTTADVSAVTIGSQVMGMFTYLMLGFATGTTVLMGRHFGARDEKALGRTVGTSILLFCGVAAGFTALLLLLGRPIVALMQTPAEAVAPARGYLLVCAVGVVFIVGYNLVAAMLNGLGDTKTPLFFVAVACGVNIVLDVVFVRGLGLGAVGAALATVLAQAASLLFALAYLKKRGLGFRFLRRDIRLDRGIVRQVVKIGAPVAVQNAMVSLSFLFITAIINGMGLAASAAVGVVEKLINILTMPAIAFGAAVATVSAQNLGAGLPARAAKSLWLGIGMALAPSVAVVVFCQFGGALLASVFNNDPEVVSLAALYLRSYCMDCIAVSFVFCLNGYFNSSGYSWFTLLHSAVATLAGRLPLSYLFSQLEGSTLYTVGWAAPLSTLVSLLMGALFLVWLRHRQARTAPA